MRTNLLRYKKMYVALCSGGISLGLLQGFEMVNFASIFASWLAQFLSALITILFGGEVPGATA